MLSNRTWIDSVKPVYNGHCWDFQRLSIIDRFPFNQGLIYKVYLEMGVWRLSRLSC